jgi:hypothetical protein
VQHVPQNSRNSEGSTNFVCGNTHIILRDSCLAMSMTICETRKVFVIVVHKHCLDIEVQAVCNASVLLCSMNVSVSVQCDLVDW